MIRQAALHGLRVLVAEDEGLVALEIAHTLERLGCRVVGPVPRVKDVIRLAREGGFDAAVLDVNLRGEYVFAALPELMERSIPVVLATGYSDLSLVPNEFRALPRLPKPFDNNNLESVCGAVFAPATA
jgi:DNA-binding NtrC family response regulator